jgi:hypothetical protein
MAVSLPFFTHVQSQVSVSIRQLSGCHIISRAHMEMWDPHDSQWVPLICYAGVFGPNWVSKVKGLFSRLETSLQRSLVYIQS